MDKRIETIVKWFDYEKVHNTMTYLGWAWAGSEQEDSVPSIGELVLESVRLLEEAARHQPTEEERRWTTGTGGFEAISWRDGTLELNFVLTSMEDNAIHHPHLYQF